MNVKYTRILIAVVGLMSVFTSVGLCQAAAATPPPAQAAAPVNDVDLPRFARIVDSFAVGAQPTTAGIRKLSELGFKTILNLVSLKEGSMLESKTVEFYGMKFINVEFTAENFNDALLAEFIQTVENKELQPVFAHCKTGNRIAAMLMVYRVKKEGWQFETALQEANKIGLTDSPIRDAVFKFLGKATF